MISRKQALAENLKRYFTGKPCKRGHISERQTSNGVCLTCHNLKERKADTDNPERMSKRNKAYYKKHSDREKTRQREYYAANTSACIDAVRDYQRRNPHVKRAIDAKRRSAKLSRTPPWADLKAIKQFYKDCPEGYQVDHIVPLQGETVSGLHVPENLQYLTPSKNASKGNKFNPEEFPSQRPTNPDGLSHR